jgi:hypothetical protein
MRGARASLLLFFCFLIGGYYLRSGWYATPHTGASNHPPLPPTAVTGEVRDEHGPLSRARVRFRTSPTATLTDSQGRFSLTRTAASPQRVTAWKEGYLIAGCDADASPVRLQLERLPQEDNDCYVWVDPTPNRTERQNCGNCHAEIHHEWAASGHARSISNPHFRNIYDGSDARGRRKVGWNLLEEHPDGAGVCTSCHAPTVSFDDPAYDDLRLARGPAAHGVHCDYCHKVADVDNRHFGLTHGRFGLKLLRPTEGQLFLGPLDDVDRGEDTFSPLYRDSRYCASCHEGTVFGVPVYSTYSEWLDSPARREGKQCQTCHMIPTGRLTNLAPGKGGLERDPQSLANHRFFAGSQADMLRQCLSVTVWASPRDREVRTEVTVRVDGVGHHVPTGFIDRHLIVVVEAFGLHNEPIRPKAGSPLLPTLAGTRLQGLAGRLYAKQTVDFDGLQPIPFWRARPEMVDTRLVPDRTDRGLYTFPGQIGRLRFQVLYRRFWEEVALAKGWGDYEIQLVDHSLKLSPGQEIRWSGP